MNGRLLTRRIVPTLVAALSLGLAAQANAALTISARSDQLVIDDATGDMNVVTFWRGQDESDQQVIYVHQAQGPNDIPQGYPSDNFPAPPQNPPPLTIDLTQHCVDAGGGTAKCTSTTGKFKTVTATLGAQRDFISNPTLDGSQPLDPTTAVTLNGEEDSDVIQGTDNGDTLIG